MTVLYLLYAYQNHKNWCDMSIENSDDIDEDKEYGAVKSLAYKAVIFVVSLVLIYAAVIIILTWPISTPLSVGSGGVFGDSFGILTALFSGLAFAGIIITILLQRIELKLQRKELRDNRIEFSKSAEAQKKNAQLVALTTLLHEYDSQHSRNVDLLRQMDSSPSLASRLNTASQVLEREKWQNNLDLLVTHKQVVQGMIESVLIDTGIDVRKIAKSIMSDERA